MKQFVQFYKKDFLAVLVYFILLLSCVLSSTVYLLRCRQYSIHPNVIRMDLSFTSRYDDWSILLSVHIYIVLFLFDE